MTDQTEKGEWVLLVDAPRGTNIPAITYGGQEALAATARNLEGFPCVRQMALVPRADLEALR